MSESESENGEAANHVASLKRLKEKDPDFYEFLKQNDKELLEFENSDVDDEEEIDDAEGESEEEEEDDILSTGSMSANKLKFIKEHIQSNPSVKICRHLISAFKSAVQQADGSQKKTNMSHSDLFNNIIKLCIVELVPALNKILKLSTEEGKKKSDPSKSKLWRSIKTSMKSYLIDMLKLFNLLNDNSALTILLKHLVNLIPFFTPFIKISRSFVKRMITLWSGEEETIRVLSLIVIVRTTRNYAKEYLNIVLKAMYFAYIKNTKFTSASTWPMINFMKRSLAEIYSLNPELAYEHAFIYIRQLSIHLRNAITIKKKESFQTVYNWQYVHCVLHWSNLLCRLQNHEAIKGLIYPLVQTMIGAVNLIPTSRYVPLRFHLIKGLMDVSESTGSFIPILPLILDVLKITDYNKKSTFSVKPIDFTCALKVTKSQLQEAGFKDSCISEVCTLLVQYLAANAHSIGFPELALSAVIQIKVFRKNCKVAKYNQQLKTVLGKIEENSLFISEKRRLVAFSINDCDQVNRWEEELKEKGVPLSSSKKKSASVAAVSHQKSPVKSVKKKDKASTNLSKKKSLKFTKRKMQASIEGPPSKKMK